MATDIQDNRSQEAQPEAKNTARPPINPIDFGEVELAKLLKTRFSGEEEKASGSVDETDPEQASADAEGRAEEAEEPAAAEDQPEPQDESPGDVGSDDEDGESSPGIRKRIDKLTRQKKEALERVESLERELEETKVKQRDEAPAVSVSDAPFAEVWDVAKLGDEWTKARTLKRWCEDNADGCEVEGKEYSSEDIKQIRRKVEDAIDVHIPERARYLQAYQQLKPVAETLYPWWKERSSVEYTAAQDVLRQMPQLRRLPEHQVLIGDFLEGRRIRMQRESGAKGGVKPPVVPRKAPSQPGKLAASPVRKDVSKVQLQAAKTQFKKSGTQTELAQLLKRML
jgi:hypothetical protein